MSRFVGQFFPSRSIKGEGDARNQTSSQEWTNKIKDLFDEQTFIDVSTENCCSTLKNWTEEFKLVKTIYAKKLVKVHRFRCRCHGYHNLIAKQITNGFLSGEEVIWTNLKHNHIVSLFAIKKGIKTTTFLMEDCPLGDLLQVMNNRRVLYSDDEVRVIVRQLLQALSYLHKRSIVHLDVKSNNIFMLKNGWIKLGDFGHAKYYHPVNNATNICGTLSFAAPEIFDHNFSPKSDIWSVGVTIFNLLTGIYPFEHEETSNPNITMARILASCYRELENITPQQDALFKRLFKINPDERPTALRFLYTDEWVISPTEFSRFHGSRHEHNFRSGRLSVYSPSIPYRNVVVNSSTPAAE